MTSTSFYRTEYSPLLGMAIALTADAAAGEDLVQEVFNSAHGRWDRISQCENPRAWLRRVLINRATSRRRRLGSGLKALTRVGPPSGTARLLRGNFSGLGRGFDNSHDDSNKRWSFTMSGN